MENQTLKKNSEEKNEYLSSYNETFHRFFRIFFDWGNLFLLIRKNMRNYGKY
jgi:hypothetical protein